MRVSKARKGGTKTNGVASWKRICEEEVEGRGDGRRGGWEKRWEGKGKALASGEGRGGG